MPAFGLTILATGAVLLYCAIKDIAITDFFRGIVSGNPAQPRAPVGPKGPVGTPGQPSTPAPAGPRGPAGTPQLSPVPKAQTTGGKSVLIQARWLPIIAQITRLFGVTVESGYRTAQHNAEVGGAPNSDHLTGNAVDFVGPAANMKRLYDWAQRLHFPYVEPWSQTGGSHVHISFSRAAV